MTLAQTYSWIFYAVASASNSGPSKFLEIEKIADGINHAIPTHKEISESTTWLNSMGLIVKDGKKFDLTEKGKQVFKGLSKESRTIMEVWSSIEAYIAEQGVDNIEDVNPNRLAL
jgi:predicted transcriptional regulator